MNVAGEVIVKEIIHVRIPPRFYGFSDCFAPCSRFSSANVGHRRPRTEVAGTGSCEVFDEICAYLSGGDAGVGCGLFAGGLCFSYVL